MRLLHLAPALTLSLGLSLPISAAAQSTATHDADGATKAIPSEAITLSADFEGALDESVNTAYFCKGVVGYVAAPIPGRPGNKALMLTLDPARAGTGRCEAPNAHTERAELAEPDALRLPQGTEVWYGFRFMIPATMKGEFVGERLVLAQLKQHPDTCPLHEEPFGVSAASEGNPTLSLRLIEDGVGDVMGLQLAVSSNNVRKISVGQLMRHRADFLDRWHDVVLHVRIVPNGDCPCEDTEYAVVGFVEGWLDGQPFANGRYGVLDGTGAPDKAEPFGYTGLVGCTYFKYGIYRDSQAEPWSIAFDRFRRGATRQSVEADHP